MNLVEKTYALLVHPDIRIWHYEGKEEQAFEYWYEGQSYWFDTMEEMINAAYDCIDLLLKPLPPPLKPLSTPSLVGCGLQHINGVK